MFRTLTGSASAPNTTLTPENVAAAITSALSNTLHHANGETIYLHHDLA